ncbi:MULTISPECIES: NTP transferase domain-containing protein [unclassified Leeuwenhoekiella]|uniref:acylneuraminate cytidylyltransferase family protein n=1 Tax=unclassified Leeuwenhoekiella TaxID=2615029 RepID=UPI000C65F096|nr:MULTISPECIES: acylneuraminate cytidylyltransferase family protein [unclassified Leeuwenhoekiella]MAW96669.1 acylneuraminate cytidylyltransferase [Leeuwenhoekiella sp.]MBA81558.1 acylneuraminate cytidylyltransferase [Leeuwenhoekiella sp.]|tara:strand:- start:95547 stop:96206 length:660 start_codon:yes stop_codon:yes gene_type:complete
MKNYLVLIPARAGSQRLPGKNIRQLGDKPLIGYSIDYAKENDLEDIVITSNDTGVLDYAVKSGVQTVERPHALAGHQEPVVTAIQHAVNQLRQQYDAVILLQPTNPLRPKGLLKDAIAIFEREDCDSLMTVSRNEHKLGTISNNRFTPYNYKMGQRSQDLEPLYYENGLLYIFKTELLKEGKLLGENNHPLVVDHPFAEIDIDTEADFKKAKLYLKFYN